MSLKVYTNREQIPVGTEYVNYNDKFFQSILLQNTDKTKVILSKIDEAQYNSDLTFIGRDKELGALNKENLSTGCKTLLNILSNPEICFDVVECGPNALELLCLVDNGCILWENPILHLIGNKTCDIETGGLRFYDFKSFLKCVMGDD